MCLRTSSNKKPCQRDVEGNSSCTSDWACLPKDLHCLILDKLLDPFDHLRFPVVCKDWYAAAKCYNLRTHRWHNKALPMILVPPSIYFLYRSHNNNDEDPRLYSIFEKTVYRNLFFPSQPFGRMRKCGCSGSEGWFASATDYHNVTTQLVNIFRKAMTPFRLPSFHHLKHCSSNDRCISSITLSDDPLLNPGRFMVIVVFLSGRCLALTKGGQTSWTHIEPKYEIQGEPIFYKNRVYAIRKKEGSILSLDVNSEPLEFQQVSPKFDCSEIFDEEYLVKSAKGDFLWHVRRHRVFNTDIKSDDYFYSLGRMNVPQAKYIDNFRVYKVNVDDSIVKQTEVKSIGDEVLFVGNNECYSILASKFPMCHKNSIYYTIDSERSGKNTADKRTDVSIFNLEDLTTNITPGSIRAAPIYWTIPPFSGLY